MLDICQRLPERDLELLKLLKNKSDGWHEFSPRFNFFTIHGRVHTDNIFENLAILINGGQGGIRTLGTGLRYTHFPGVLIRPL